MSPSVLAPALPSLPPTAGLQSLHQSPKLPGTKLCSAALIASLKYRIQCITNTHSAQRSFLTPEEKLMYEGIEEYVIEISPEQKGVQESATAHHASH